MLGHRRSEMRFRDEDLDDYEEEGYGEEGEGYGLEGEGYELEEEGYGLGEEGYGEEEEDDGEEEEEEDEEEHKPTPEELEYLTMREKLKDKLRLKVQKENAQLLGRSGGLSELRRPPANTEFGSFFGPSKPVIARRVIEERHSLQEMRHMKAKESTSKQFGQANASVEKRPQNAVPNGQAKTHAQSSSSRKIEEIRNKAQILKGMRDYSFLLSDDTDDVPAPSRVPPPKNTSGPPFDARAAQAPPNRPTKGEMSAENHRKKSTFAAAQKVPTKVASQNAPSSSSMSKSPVPKKILNGNVGMAHGSHQNPSMKKPSAPPPNRPAAGNPSLVRQTSAIKPGSSAQKSDLERRKEIQGLSQGKLVAKQPESSSQRPQQQILPNKQKTRQVLSSKPQPSSKPIIQRPPQKPTNMQQKPTNLQQKPTNMHQKPTNMQQKATYMQHKPSNLQHKTSNVQHKPSNLQHKPSSLQHKTSNMQHKPSNMQQRPAKMQQKPAKMQQKPVKRKPLSRYSDDEDEGEAAISMIRSMFRYNPNKYAEIDDDVSDMEANFQDIMREERRSGIIGKREDDEQLRLIEEEEERERLRKLRKKKQRIG